MKNNNTTAYDILYKALHDKYEEPERHPDWDILIRAMQKLQDVIAAYALHPLQSDAVEWIDVFDEYPQDCQKVWFYSPKYESVIMGTYYKIDAFKRANMFISSNGGHYQDVTLWQPLPLPKPPKP